MTGERRSLLRDRNASSQLATRIFVGMVVLGLIMGAIAIGGQMSGARRDRAQFLSGQSQDGSQQEWTTPQLRWATGVTEDISPGTARPLTNVEREALLDAHNHYRSLTASGKTPNQPPAVSMEKLLWDPILEKVAQNYGVKCKLEHNLQVTQEYAAMPGKKPFKYTDQQVGENIYYTSQKDEMSVLVHGVEMFYNENQWYNFAADTCSAPPGKFCGHYKEMMTDIARYMACAVSICPGTQSPTRMFCLYVAVPYFMRRPYESGTTCTKCPADRSKCEGGLCIGCPSPGYYECELDRYSKCETDVKAVGWCNYCNNPNQQYNQYCRFYCPKTCGYCPLPAAELASPKCCPRLDPAAGCSA